jgi:PiT family inorganic phosphate transporter
MKNDKISLFFALLMVLMGGYFLGWGVGYTNASNVLIFILASMFGIFMAFNIGGNDVANSFGTSVGAGTLTMKQALLVAAIFEVSGAIIAGGEVTKTIRSDIVDLSGIAVMPDDFMYIMMSALLAAALWLLFASKRGYPVSTTHSIIGGIVGSSIMLGSILSDNDVALGLVQWDKVGSIAASWVISPVLGGLVSWVLFYLIKKHILLYNEAAEEKLHELKEEKKRHEDEHDKLFDSLDDVQQIAYANAKARDAQLFDEGNFDPEALESDYYKGLHQIECKKDEIKSRHALENWVPLVAALGAIIIAAMLVFKGLKNLDVELTTLYEILILSMVGTFVWLITLFYARSTKKASLSKSTFMMFSWMQVFTASGFAFSHGSNDIANAIGPFAAILDVLKTGVIGTSAAIPTPAMVTFGVALVAGLWFIGREVIMTVGHHLTHMHPASGFSAELAAATVVLMASLLGIPVSSTHILIGAVLGIGVVNAHLNWKLMKPIALAWVITLPAAGLLSALLFVLLRSIF